MATIIYFHGFASVGEGPKTDTLRAALPDHTVIAPDIPVDPVAAADKLKTIIRTVDSFPLILVGTSLGGFWANYMAQKFDAPCILVNPSVSPSKTMSSRVGQDLQNYKTGEKIVVTPQHLREYVLLEEELHELYNGALVHLFLAKDDDVIPYRETLSSFLRNNMSCDVSETGGHRYSHFDKVVDKVKELV